MASDDILTQPLGGPIVAFAEEHGLGVVRSAPWAIRIGGQAFLSLRAVWQRWFLWVVLAVLVLVLLATVVWLAGRHEAEQVQEILDRDTADAAADLRSGLQRNVQGLRALQANGLAPDRWHFSTGDFSAELLVDPEGLVLDYSGLFRSLAYRPG